MDHRRGRRGCTAEQLVSVEPACTIPTKFYRELAQVAMDASDLSDKPGKDQTQDGRGAGDVLATSCAVRSPTGFGFRKVPPVDGDRQHDNRLALAAAYLARVARDEEPQVEKRMPDPFAMSERGDLVTVVGAFQAGGPRDMILRITDAWGRMR